ncbi:hypothetical protein GQ53DRAFT_150339 [Thozetella sp. PMI_491]|nr:hypothetical protein GQ53DRAFT_150339 [Thozetella sp. PMI_491]
MSGEPRRLLPRTSYLRRRAVTACRVCRERKKKCDNSRPACAFCRQIGARCEYAERDESTFDPASLAILDRLSIIETLVRIQQPPSTAESYTPKLQNDQLKAFAVSDELETVQDYAVLPSNAWSLDPGASLNVRTDKILQWPVFEEALSSLPRFPFLNYHKEQDYTYLGDAFYEFPSPHDPSRWSGVSQPAPPISICTEQGGIEPLVDRFFALVHAKNPILDRQVVEKYCREYYENGPLFNATACLVLLICALGSIAPDFEPADNMSRNVGEPFRHPAATERLQRGHCYFAAAEKRLIVAGARCSTLGVQCLCLAGIYHMYTLNPMAAQTMFHMAGLNLQMLISTGIDSNEGMPQMGSSLFWACFKSEREIFAEVPITPPALNRPEEFSGYPLPPQDTSIHAGMNGWARTEEDSWLFLLSELALRRISDKVAEVVANFFEKITNAPQQTNIEELAPVVLEFERQAQAWRDHLPVSVKFPDLPHLPDTEWKLHLRGPYYRVIELMYRPFIFASIHFPNPSPMVQTLASKGLHNAACYIRHGHPTLPHHGRWLQIRYELRAICMLLAASKSPVEMSQGWHEAVQAGLKSLEYWEHEAPFVKSYIHIVLTLRSYFETRGNKAPAEIGHNIDIEVQDDRRVSMGT